MENNSFHFKFKVGGFECMAIHDGDANDWDRNVLLIKTDQQNVLIDTGNGIDLTPRGFLLDRLQAVGISPADVDVVILSHADWDHIGGAADEKGEPVFPRARYVLPKAEWDFWASKPERLRREETFDEEFRRVAQQVPELRLSQLRNRLELSESEVEIVSGIRYIAAPGHTPGYTAITVVSNDEHLMFIGDMIYDPKDIENPDWYAVYDYDPKQAIVTRRRIFGQAAGERALLLAYHVTFPGLGHIEEHGSGWHWTPLEKIEITKS